MGQGREKGIYQVDHSRLGGFGDFFFFSSEKKFDHVLCNILHFMTV